MKQIQFRKSIAFDTDEDWTELKQLLLARIIQYFKWLGLYCIENENRLTFKRNVQKANDFIKTGTRSDILNIIRNAEIELFDTDKPKKKIELKVDLTYLIVLAIGFSMVFCLGTIYYMTEIGLVNYISIAFIIFILTFGIGYLYIKLEMRTMINKLLDKEE